MESITVYVTLGAGNLAAQRDLTFKIPNNVPQKDLRTKGFAIDGNEALVTVAYEDDGYTSALMADYAVSLGGALSDTETIIEKFLEEHGYEVTFK